MSESMRDSDGFAILTRKPIPAQTKPKEKKIKNKKIKNPFKKGSWKHHFWKESQSHNTPRVVEKFHNTRIRNFVIHKNQKGRYLVDAVSQAAPPSYMKTLKSHDDVNILIAVGDRMYMDISRESYKKLKKIDKVTIEFTLTAWADGVDESEGEDLLHETQVIDNINDLLSYINYHRQCVYGIYDIQAKCCWYTYYNFKFRMLVTNRDGTYHTYKGDLNEFIKDYGLYQI